MEDRTQAELEALSAYLDGELPDKQRIDLEARLLENDDLQAAFDRLRWTRALLRNTPRLIRKRSFTLTPEMAAAHAKPTGLFPTMRLVSALATILFVIVVGGDLAANLVLTGMRASNDMESIAAAPEMMEMESLAEETLPAAAADTAIEEPVEDEAVSAEGDDGEAFDGDTAEDIQDDTAGEPDAEMAPPQGTPAPPVGMAQGGEEPEKQFTPGAGGADESPVEATAILPATDEADIQAQEAERAAEIPEEGQLIEPLLIEPEAEEVIETQPVNYLLIFLRIAEVLLGVTAVGAGIWAWLLRRS
ncbi:MAG: hypothetical protein OEV06_10470 [Anaerolineae bacterium]|nr:hypothetical protein [Anaerolineae bacterium]